MLIPSPDWFWVPQTFRMWYIRDGCAEGPRAGGRLLSVPAFVGSPGKEILLRSQARVDRWGARTALMGEGEADKLWRHDHTVGFLSTDAHIPFSWLHPNQHILPHQFVTFQPLSDPRGSADLTGMSRTDFCPSEDVFKLLLQELKPFILSSFHLAACGSAYWWV